LRGFATAEINRRLPVSVAVDDQGRDGDRPQFGAEVSRESSEEEFDGGRGGAVQTLANHELDELGRHRDTWKAFLGASAALPLRLSRSAPPSRNMYFAIWLAPFQS
jgi:hypothetical protein